MIIYCHDRDEGAVTDCPSCGSTAVVTDSGIRCTNSDCPKS